MSGPSAEPLVRRFLDALLAGDEGALRETLAADAVLVLPRPGMSGQTIAGADNLAAALGGLIRRYRDATARYGTVLADERSAAVEWRLTAKLVSNGADYEQFYCWVFDVAEGRIAEIREYIDTAYGRRMSDATSDTVLSERAGDER